MTTQVGTWTIRYRGRRRAFKNVMLWLDNGLVMVGAKHQAGDFMDIKGVFAIYRIDETFSAEMKGGHPS